MPAWVVSAVLLAAGGIAVFFHLEHWERIFNGFGHITSGITQELIGCVALAIANDSHLMADLPWIAESIQLRNIYTDPLNVLQAELLHRSRLAEEKGEKPDPRVEQALMVTIAGVAAGMRNTG